MKKTKIFASSLIAAIASFGISAFAAEEKFLEVKDVAPDVSISVKALPPLIVEGTNPPQGVAGAFISVSMDTPGRPHITVAGGALFPDKGPADGGEKKYCDDIWKLYPDGDGKPAEWRHLELKLPVPMAYGIDMGNGYWSGGENKDGKLDIDVTYDSLKGQLWRAEHSLPAKIDNAASAWLSPLQPNEPEGAIIAGGNVNGVPTCKAWMWDTGREPQRWVALPDFPGTPRVQPVAGIVRTPRGMAFALVGGFYFDKETKKATVDRAGVIYYPKENKWEMLPPLPEEISEAGLVGSCAVEDYRGRMLIFGGVNAKIFKEALENPAPDYLRHEPEWYKFNADVLRLSFDKDGKAKWEKLATVPATARAGASALRVFGVGSIYFVCGELKPGFRSPDCCHISVKKNQTKKK